MKCRDLFRCPLRPLQAWEPNCTTVHLHVNVSPPEAASWELYMVYLWGGLQHVGAHNPFSVFNTPTLLLESPAWTLNLWASLRLWELTNNLNPPPPTHPPQNKLPSPPGCGGDGARCFTVRSVLYVSAKSYFYGLLIHSCCKWFTYRGREPS